MEATGEKGGMLRRNIKRERKRRSGGKVFGRKGMRKRKKVLVEGEGAERKE